METDLPLYMVARYLKCRYPDSFGKDRMLVTQGELHIKIMLQIASGQFQGKFVYSSALVNRGL